MGKRAVLVAGLVALAAGPVALAAEQAAAAQKGPRASRVHLKAFRSCTGMIRYARRHALRTAVPRGAPGAPFGQGGPETKREAAQPAPGVTPLGAQDDSSTTNVQEAGVDEPDIVKTDGSLIFALAGRTLHAIDARATPPRLLGSLRLTGFGHELLLHEGRALVVSQADTQAPVARGASAIPPYLRSATLLSEVDVGDPAGMRVARTLEVDGDYVSARLNGATARVVISSSPRALVLPSPPTGGPETVGDAAERYRSAIRRSRTGGWRPSALLRDRRSGRRTRRALVACRAVRRPPTFSGLDMLTVLTIDLSRGLPAIDSDALLTGGETVYASTRSLYVATERWLDPELPAARLPQGISTAIHQFDISDPERTEYRASGRVRGFVLNQWALSEHRGFLRVASTDVPVWLELDEGRESESFVTVLEQRASALAEVGRVGGLGGGERIYAVRFIGDVGFVVTFRQTDPLYTLDLSTPARPEVLGELKLLGYSAYLHPLGDDLLLGVGQDATAEGRVRGTQLSLFDISDLRNPVRLHQRALGGGSSSEVELDHHAFLYWPPSRLAVVPVESFPDEGEGTPAFAGAIGFRVDRASGIEEAGRVSHRGDDPLAVRRSLVVGDRLFTLSERGLMASSLDTLAELAWLPFPAPAG